MTLLGLALASAAPGHALRGDEALGPDVAATALGGAVWLQSELGKPMFAAACRVCESNAVDIGVRAALRLDDTSRLDAWSTPALLAPAALGFVSVATLALHGSVGEAAANVTYVVEAIVVAADVNQAAKYSFARLRPYAWALGPDAALADPDAALSFYSGHTTLAFAAAAAAGTLADLRGYRAAPWVWAVGLTVATGVGYTRIAGDDHWLTDVAAGAGMGVLSGELVPRLLHPRVAGASAVRVSVVPGPVVVASGGF